MEDNEKYLHQLESTLNLQKELLARLENRVQMLTDSKPLTEYEDNENQILIIKSNAEINSLRLIIKEKHDYFVKYTASIGKEEQNIDDKFDAVWEKAVKKSKYNDTLKKIIESVDVEKTKKHRQSKLYLYNKLSSLVNE